MGLTSLEEVVGDLTVDRNGALESLDGAAGLRSIGDALSIRDNTLLCQADAESFADSVDVGGTTTVSGNDGCD